MANLKQINLFIDRSSYSLGSICSIHYDYFVVFEQMEIDHEAIFHIFVELWGVDLISEKRLSEENYDEHQFRAKHSMDIARSFVVPCHLLNERVGKDDIFIKLVLKQGNQRIDVLKSNEVSERF